MGAWPWIGEHWFDLLQTVGIVGGLLFTAYSLRKEDAARRIANTLSIAQHHRSIWRELYERPELTRVLEANADLKQKPITDAEKLFVTFLILHLDTVHRAMKAGMFVHLDGLRKDIKGFFALPIPRAVWEKGKALHNDDFVGFVEKSWAE